MIRYNISSSNVKCSHNEKKQSAAEEAWLKKAETDKSIQETVCDVWAPAMYTPECPHIMLDPTFYQKGSAGYRPKTVVVGGYDGAANKAMSSSANSPF